MFFFYFFFHNFFDLFSIVVPEINRLMRIIDVNPFFVSFIRYFRTLDYQRVRNNKGIFFTEKIWFY